MDTPFAPMVCECGAKFAPGATFCAQCGKARKEESNFKIMLRKALIISGTPNFLKVFLGTWIMFIITLCFFTYGYMAVPMLCWTWTAMVIVLLVIFTPVFSYWPNTVNIAIGIFIAVVLGSILGMYVYDSAAIFPMFYSHARKYTNVVSSEPSAAVADAGKITFSQETKVNVSMGVGYTAEDGVVYCAAPIVDPSRQPRIEFWAAGINCCAESGDFNCDAAANPEAQGGVVIFDNNGWFTPARYPYYQKARAKAEAQFMLQSVGEPLFVRWVEKDNLDYLQNYYSSRAAWTIVTWVFIFMLISAFLSCGLWQPRSMVSS